MLQLDIDALDARLLNNMDVTNLQIQIMNQPPEDIDETRIFCRWIIEPGSSQEDVVGVRITYQQFGLATLQIVVPKGTWMEDAYAVRDQFAALFRNWRSPDKKLRVYGLENELINGKDGVTINCRALWYSGRQS